MEKTQIWIHIYHFVQLMTTMIVIRWRQEILANLRSTSFWMSNAIFIEPVTDQIRIVGYDFDRLHFRMRMTRSFPSPFVNVKSIMCRELMLVQIKVLCC